MNKSDLKLLLVVLSVNVVCVGTCVWYYARGYPAAMMMAVTAMTVPIANIVILASWRKGKAMTIRSSRFTKWKIVSGAIVLFVEGILLLLRPGLLPSSDAMLIMLCGVSTVFLGIWDGLRSPPASS